MIKFTVLREMLLIREEDDDITAGLRSAVGTIETIKSNWQGGADSARKARIASLKKLTPAERRMLREKAVVYLTQCIRKIDSEPSTSTVMDIINTKQEAVAAANVFGSLGNKNAGTIEQFGRSFLSNARDKGHIDDAEYTRLLAILQSDIKMAVTPEAVNFFADSNHLDFFVNKVFKLTNDLNDITIDAADSAHLLSLKIEQMTGEAAARKPEAVALVIYGLQRIRMNVMRMVTQLEIEAKKRAPSSKKPAEETPPPSAP